jgi:hypothetical protein
MAIENGARVTAWPGLLPDRFLNRRRRCLNRFRRRFITRQRAVTNPQTRQQRPDRRAQIASRPQRPRGGNRKGRDQVKPLLITQPPAFNAAWATTGSAIAKAETRRGARRRTWLSKNGSAIRRRDTAGQFPQPHIGQIDHLPCSSTGSVPSRSSNCGTGYAQRQARLASGEGRLRGGRHSAWVLYQRFRCFRWPFNAITGLNPSSG